MFDSLSKPKTVAQVKVSKYAGTSIEFISKLYSVFFRQQHKAMVEESNTNIEFLPFTDVGVVEALSKALNLIALVNIQFMREILIKYNLWWVASGKDSYE